MKIIKRHIQKQIESRLFTNNILIIYGPRQAGKTTLVKEIVKKHTDSIYINCELPDIRDLLSSRDIGSIYNYIKNYNIVVFDEVHTISKIGELLKILFDTYKDIQFIATGSSSFELSQQVGEPLVGRSWEFMVLPLSLREITENNIEVKNELTTYMLYGGYPEIYHLDPIDKKEKLTSIAYQYASKDVFAFDLEKNTIYLSPRFYKDKFTGDQSAEFTVFAILHEIGHFREKLEMLSEFDGVRDFQKYLDKIKKDKAFALIDNLVADISINREVISRTNTDYKKREYDLYTKDLFPLTDFTDAPKHIQFGQAILREHRVLGEMCVVDEDVRAEIEKLRQYEKGDIIDIMTNPDITMSMRLKLLDKFIIPIVEKLKEKDMENRKKQQQEQKDDKKESSESDDSNEIFKDDYEKAQKGMMDPKHQPKESGQEGDVDSDIGKAFEKALEDYLEKYPNAKSLDTKKSPEQLKKESEEQEAVDLGLDLKDLRAYDQIKDSLEEILNPENNKSVIEEFSSLFRRIISKRKNDRLVSKAPLEEGAYLYDPASLVAEVRSGNLRPHVWEDTHKKEKESDKFGEIEISLVFDRSGSMDNDGGQKKIEQRKAAVLIMEALSDFEKQLKNAKKSGNLNDELTMKNEIFSFQGTVEDNTPIKSLSDKLERKTKIEISKKLSTTQGSTTDFVPLEVIDKSIEEKSIQKIKEGKLKKIVIVMTDGGSDDKTKVLNTLESLRNKGVIIIGIGITKSGEPAIETYAPKSVLAKEAKDLPVVLGNILKEHLADL